MLGLVEIHWSDKLTKFSRKDKIKMQIAIFEWLYDEIDTETEEMLAYELEGWKIFIHESSESESDEFRDLVQEGATLNPKIAHGITLKTIKEVHAFIENRSSFFPLFGGIRQGFTAIAHEIAHAIVSILVDLGIFPPRAIRKHEDKRVPAGTEGPTEVVLVHDRIWEMNKGIRKPRKYMLFGFKLWSGLRIGTTQFEGIEIRDWIN